MKGEPGRAPKFELGTREEPCIARELFRVLQRMRTAQIVKERIELR